MMKINFYPESDDPALEKAAKEYSSIWKNEGGKIQAEIEIVSGLKFKEKTINALVFNDVSYSTPLQLQANISKDLKKGTLIHELCHRLIMGNNVEAPKGKDYYDTALSFHKQNNLILLDILLNLYGEDFVKKLIDFEASLWTEKEISPYKLAWDFALSMSKQERAKKFKEYLK